MTRRIKLVLAIGLSFGVLSGCTSNFQLLRNKNSANVCPPPEEVRESKIVSPKEIEQLRRTPTERKPESPPASLPEPMLPEVFADPPLQRGIFPGGVKPSSVKPTAFEASQTKKDPPPLPALENKGTSPRREPVIDAFQCILDGRHNEALDHLRKYDQGTQEIFLRLLPAMALMTQKTLDQLSAPEIAVLHEQLQSLLVSLRPRTDLQIDKMCFCEWVKAYGIYKPLPEGYGFLAKTSSRPGELVQLYVQLRNFSSEFSNGFYTTRLSSKVEIRPQGADPASEPIWFFNYDDGKQPLRCRTLLNDYFNNYSFYVPNIPPGTYALTVQVADETRPDQRRVARKSVEFRVNSVSARVP